MKFDKYIWSCPWATLALNFWIWSKDGESPHGKGEGKIFLSVDGENQTLVSKRESLQPLNQSTILHFGSNLDATHMQDIYKIESARL